MLLIPTASRGGPYGWKRYKTAEDELQDQADIGSHIIGEVPGSRFRILFLCLCHPARGALSASRVATEDDCGGGGMIPE